MRKDRLRQRTESTGDRHTWRIVDDFPADIPVGASELDVVDAFLMPLLSAVLSGDATGKDSADPLPGPAAPQPEDSEQPQKAG